MTPLFKRAAAAALLLSSSVGAQETTVTSTVTSVSQETTVTTAASSATGCATVLTPSYSAPVVAKGWKAQLVATGLSRPRGIKFDSNGGLLVVEAGARLTHLAFNDNGGTCLSVKTNTTVFTDEDVSLDTHTPPQLNHGLELSEDGRTLYVSTSENVDRHMYDPDTMTVTNLTRLVVNMSHADGGGHVSRTLLLSRKQPDLLLVSRGSDGNLDPLAADESTGVSQIRAFNISAANTTDIQRPYSYPTDGILIGWGLRNSVGVAEHPTTGGLYSVENSADEIARLGRDIHEDNPGEELNFHGFLNDTSSLGANHGYPSCFALWNTTDNFPSLGKLQVGDQFALANNASTNDTACAEHTTSPRLTFRAHTAPLDIKFSPGSGNGSNKAFISFHGSWNRDHPAGYKLSYVDFSAETGEPVAASDSLTAVKDVLTAPDVSACGGGAPGGPAACFRPVGMAFDATGERLFVSSDATGEIWVVMRDGHGDDGSSTTTTTTGAGGGNNGTPTGTGAPESSTSTAAAVRGVEYRGMGGWVVGVVTAVMVAVGGLGFAA
ncbi:hypothetical protein C8A00DRAFT_12065 [Chaetomidium leptoderma]|uniref:Pyrroloquinoline quinone-dependent pyranose dehydrogenase beta-propeller domain-containing protein n=1 Tax=Chaetomidium leptoderma TaxID=669021 RepID=A0AAN6VTH5_9PEZI|nr:hypothetical protein C8A00DRAFT_12065 [Chaetomidium leptoderma]